MSALDACGFFAALRMTVFRRRQEDDHHTQRFVGYRRRFACEYATILGKPDRAFFEQALRSIGVPASEAVMIGDDIENDIGGAQKAGIRTLLVCTGKHNADSPLLERIHPDAILSSIKEVQQWLELIL